jgi:hypothetical protein
LEILCPFSKKRRAVGFALGVRCKNPVHGSATSHFEVRLFAHLVNDPNDHGSVEIDKPEWMQLVTTDDHYRRHVAAVAVAVAVAVSAGPSVAA